jgi:zinc/manganese transport system permease protein
MINLSLLYDALIGPFIEFSFMRRALIGAFALSLGAGPVGVFLMLRRMSLIGDAMAHAILPGAAIGYLAAGMIIALAAGLVTRSTVLKEDAALASFYLISLAAGVVLVSLKGSNIDLLHVLFGSILALDDATLILLAAATSISLLALAVIFRALVLESVDPTYARLMNAGGAYTNILFLSLVVINLVAGFHALGTLLSVGLMMLPAFAARFWTERLAGLMGISIGFGFLSSVIGIITSYHLNTPTGPTIILVSGALYLFSILFGQRSGLIVAKIHRPHLAR